MAGRGPAPKPASRRVRTDSNPLPVTVLKFEQSLAPDLPDDVEWHPRTVAWWQMWQRSPQSDTFTESDWSFLLDTALMHTAMWAKGQWTLAAEVRLRVAKFGATPEDRARLRMVFADADEKDEKRAKSAGSARERYGNLRVLPAAVGAEAVPAKRARRRAVASE
jgi:hypothetical protein